MEKEIWKALLTGKRDLRWQLKLVIGMYSFIGHVMKVSGQTTQGLSNC